MTTPERSCYTCRWANGNACIRPHLSEEMDAAIDAYAVASGCHRNGGGMPLDRNVVCPGHEASEGCAHLVEPFRVDPNGTVVGKCALCGDNTFVIREGDEDSPKQEGQFAIWTEHVTAPNRMPEPNSSLEGMISSEICEVKAGMWLLSSGNGATHWRLHSIHSSFEEAYAAHQNLLSDEGS